MPGGREQLAPPPPPGEVAEWDALAVGPGGTVRQTSWWDAPLRALGVSSTVVVSRREGVLAGGALVRATGLRGVPVTIGDCVGGPLVRHDDPAFSGTERDEVVADVVDQVAALARSRRMVQLNLQVPSPSVAEAVVRSLCTQGGEVRRCDQPRRAVVALPGDADDLMALLSSHHRRRIRKAADVVVAATTEPAELRAAYRALESTANRKGFADLRPWSALAPALDEGIARGAIEVLVARTSTAADEVLGAIVLAHTADRTEYLYGGYVDAASTLGVTHPLHLAAMRIAVARGAAEYDLGQLQRPDAPTGVDRFKLGFGAAVIADPDRIEWVRSPRLGAAITSLRRARWARKPLSVIQSRRQPSATDEVR